MLRRSAQQALLQVQQSAGWFGGRALSTSSQSLVPQGLGHKQEQEQQAAQPALPCVPSMLLPGKKQSQLPSSLMVQQVRGMAGPSGANDSLTHENTWASFRSKYAYEKRNDLSAGMYAMILVFGFGPLVADFYAYPPRVIAIMGFVFCKLGWAQGSRSMCVGACQQGLQACNLQALLASALQTACT